MYDRLLVELRNEDGHSFQNSSDVDELMQRLTPRIAKQNTNYRPSFPGLKVSITLRHLASGTKYHDMQYDWRVPHNTISIIVREVCQAIVDEYLDEMMSTPTTETGWRQTWLSSSTTTTTAFMVIVDLKAMETVIRFK